MRNLKILFNGNDSVDRNSPVHNGSYVFEVVQKNVKNLDEKNTEKTSLSYYISWKLRV